MQSPKSPIMDQYLTRHTLNSTVSTGYTPEPHSSTYIIPFNSVLLTHPAVTACLWGWLLAVPDTRYQVQTSKTKPEYATYTAGTPGTSGYIAVCVSASEYTPVPETTLPGVYILHPNYCCVRPSTPGCVFSRILNAPQYLTVAMPQVLLCCCDGVCDMFRLL